MHLKLPPIKWLKRSFHVYLVNSCFSGQWQKATKDRQRTVSPKSNSLCAVPCQQCSKYTYVCFLWLWVIEVSTPPFKVVITRRVSSSGYMWWFWIRGLNRCRSCYQLSDNVRANASAALCLDLIKCVELNGRVETYRSWSIYRRNSHI